MSGYPRYPAYKDSGVEWLGEVPEHWKVQRLKTTARLRNQKIAAGPDLPSYVGLENIESGTGRLIAAQQSVEPEGLSNCFQPGDVLFGKLRPYLAKVYEATESGICTGELLVLQPIHYTPRLLRYYLLSDPFVRIVDSSTYGAKMPRASWEFIGNMTTPVPSAQEQATIAAFLDRETARIDTLIAKQERLIALLEEKRRALISHAVTKGLDPDAPMKESGVAWLGEVPGHWDRMHLKRDLLFVTSGSRGWSEHYSDDGDLFLRIANLRRDSIAIHLADVQRVAIPQGIEGARARVRENDLLISITADLGLAAVVPHGIDCGYVSQHVALARPSGQRAISRWWGYQLTSWFGRTQFDLQAYGGTKIQLNLDDIRTFVALVPPKDEQRRIVQYLDSAIEKVDEIAAKAYSTIALLREHRASLITAAVTGKIDVRGEAGAAPPPPEPRPLSLQHFLRGEGRG